MRVYNLSGGDVSASLDDKKLGKLLKLMDLAYSVP
jgi:hypothetical protein